MKHKDQAIAALLSSDAPCDRYACTARKRCAAELLACNALLIYVETGRAHDPRDYAPPTREVFDAIERDRAGHEHGMAYKTLKLPADRAAWAWAEFMEPGGVSELRVTCTEGEAYRRGWQDCMKVWEGHMERMNLAMRRKPKA